MDKTFTLETLIRYAYNETDLLENVEVQRAIDTNVDVAEVYDDFVSLMQQLDDLYAEPSEGAVKNIIDYASAA